ncbi:MAG: tetratricopeptide repeat protein [Pseudomonadota bacterium]
MIRALALILALVASPALAQTDAQALYRDGLRYHTGDGVLQDYETAAARMRAAAELGLADAQNHLARYHFEGLGVARDRAAALRWFEAAAQAGDPTHVLDLARVLETDPQTLPRAAQLYAQAAEAGQDDAAVSLGVLYQNGQGVTQDFDKARALYQGPAARGHPRALNNLGLLYVRANGVTQDYARAATLFQAAAEQGLAEAMRNLGVLYENGFGVPLDETRAAALYRAAGGGAAQTVGYAYDERLMPVGDDPAARAALARAASGGDPVARFQWAWMILNTPDTPHADRITAATFLRDMAAQGHPPSMLNLGLLYMRGIGVPQDYVLGHKWLLLAQAAGVDTADAALGRFADRLTADQVNAAQARAKTHLTAKNPP